MKNIVWVKAPKCAGTSILNHFSKNAKTVEKLPNLRICNFDNSSHRVYVILNGQVGSFKKNFPKVFKRSWKCAFVRNPWDRLVSGFFFGLQKGWLDSDKFTSFKSFVKNDLCKFKSSRDLYPAYPFWCFIKPLCEHLSDNNSCDYLDFVGRFENLNDDFEFVCDKIGLNNKVLPSKNKSSHKPYWEYYDESLVKIVADFYKKDIEYFKYEFKK